MEPAAATTAQRLPETSREDRASAPAAAAAVAAAAAALAAAVGGGRSPEPALTPAAPSGGAREEAPGEAHLGPMPGRPGGTGRRRRRGAPQPTAGGAAPVPGAGGGANSLLLRRGRLKRNLSAAAAAAASSSSSSSSSAAAASHSPGATGLSASCSASASLCTRSLDRKTLLLKHRQMLQLQPSDRDWVRHQLERGCVHVFDRHMASTYLRPVLCTLDTTAGEVAARLLQVGYKGGGVVKVLGKGHPDAGPRLPPGEPRDSGPPSGRSGLAAVGGPQRAPPADLPLPGAPDGWALRASRASPAPSDSSLGEPGAPRLLDGAAAGPASDTESFSLSPSAESVSDRLDPYSSGGGCSSSSEELEADPAPARTPTGAREQPRLPRLGAGSRPSSPTASPPPPQPKAQRGVEGPGGAARDRPREEKAAAAAALGRPPSTQDGNRATAEQAPPPPTLYVQLHGETTRRLEADEKPLQIQNDYLFHLGFGELWRVQEEGMDSEIGCLIRFYAGKPHSTGSSERIQLSGMYNVRKGKMQLPVNRWTRRQVILCGTCLIVSSVKDSLTGKMHVLPLIGGKVEEVKKHQHCLAFSSSGPQSQTYYICFDTFTEYLRWLRQVSKVASQRISSVDLSCCSLEHLPANLFYSQDLTHLNLKQNFLRQSPNLPTARGLNELQRFSKLKSLNLSNNHLGDFPLAVCNIPTLAELNVSCNALRAVPAAVGDMHNLQTFLLDGNFLQTLPAELENMHQLSYLGLSFNEFTDIPEVLEKLTAVDKLCMSGNCMETLRLQALRKMPHIKHVDLRLNLIRKLIADEVDFLPHVTQLDLRDNKLGELDAMVFNNIEVLHCERNQLVTLNICGYFLKALYTSSNELVQLDVYPVPNYLSYMDVSRNRLENVPEWVCESRKLEVLDIGHNQICELPARLFCNSSLRKLLAGHNQLTRLPERLERTSVEVLDVQQNQLLELPPNLLMKADSLRFLNASANKLETLPPATLSEETNSVLQELYLTNNNLTDKCVPLLTGHPHLKILHMAYNRLQSFPASKMAKLEELEEIDISGNKLKAVPTTIMNCRRMHTAIAHSNCIEVFPEVMQLPEIKCVDLSCNELSEVTLPENLPPKLQELDLTGNPRLALDHKTLELLNNIRCFKIDQPSGGDASGAPAVWSHGYTEASGVKNKLCVAALSVNNFRDNREALYGVFDGDRNVEVPYLLQCTMSDILAEELQKTKNEEEYMVNTFIVMQRKLGTAGQKLGGAAVLCHIKHDPVDPGGPFTLTSANVGKCQTVLCRNGKPLPLSRSYVMSCEEELKRIKRHKAIITEDGKVNGVTESTRILGYTFLHPSVVPRPHVQSVALTPQDEFFILGSKGLWDSLSVEEAVGAVRNVPDALAAAKKLCTLAQSYGCRDSVSAVVVQLSVPEDSFCCCELGAGGPVPPPSPGTFAPSVSMVIKERPADGLGVPSSSSGLASEMSSELSTSEMSSEVGSTASDEPPPGALSESSPACPSEPRCSLHPACPSSSFQRQLSSATFSSAFSDNGLDSDDEEPIEGVFTNGSRVEVEVDIHCGRAKEKERQRPLLQLPAEASDEGIVISANEDEPALPRRADCAAVGTMGRRRANGSVAPQERSHNVIEVATDAPLRKPGGYFAAPAQPDPDDQFIIPPELEEEVKEIMKHQQPPPPPPSQLHVQPPPRQCPGDQLPDCCDTPL
ncbi:PH domain leucine-rich repeat-containing protein phosphatase 1 [Mesoplodon densirostris]|uniref:PH domain leucine-rich repeat-containing protein phosphatase 1 n=1 Tax=Mesoplodon densirostris TaxID=48708 RepID=UPI0028DB71E0|nr:PH domain leucine-rich repeat-containing protein phosphatase 1 [Mesoplodon densirostris]